MNDPLANEQLHSLRYRGARPSQYTSATIKQDYADMLGEIQRLRSELGHAEELGEYRHSQNEQLRRDEIRQLRAELEQAGADRAQHRDQVLTEAAELIREHRGDLDDDGPWWDTRDRDTAAGLLLAARTTPTT